MLEPLLLCLSQRACKAGMIPGAREETPALRAPRPLRWIAAGAGFLGGLLLFFGLQYGLS